MDRADVLERVFKDELAKNGYPVNMDSPECDNWRSVHPDCHGCSSGLACCKLAVMQKAIVDFVLYKPFSEGDAKRYVQDQEECLHRILRAKTTEEVLALLVDPLP